jgi:hypothetical protein
MKVVAANLVVTKSEISGCWIDPVPANLIHRP